MAESDSQVSARDYYFLREEIRHEDSLINQRLSWLASSQAFMLTGFAIAVNGPVQSKLPLYERLSLALITWLPVAGVLTIVVSYLALWAAILHMRGIRRAAGDTHPKHLPMVQGTPLQRRLGLAGPVLTPLIFLTLWLIIIAQR